MWADLLANISDNKGRKLNLFIVIVSQECLEVVIYIVDKGESLVFDVRDCILFEYQYYFWALPFGS